jgi:hypothetical protein
MAIKINGGFESREGNVYFYTPAVVIGLAVTQMHDFSATEHCVFRNHEIHGFANPNKERKTTRPDLTRAFINTHMGAVKSAADKALNRLEWRRVFLPEGKLWRINKWIDEWLDLEGRPVFYEGSQALANILDSLELPQHHYWQFVAEWFRPMVPKGRTRQIPFQTPSEDNAGSVPTSIEDTSNDYETSPEDKMEGDLSSSEDEKTPNEDNKRPQTPANAQKNAPLEVKPLNTGSALPEAAPLSDFPDLMAKLRALPRGDEVCAEFRRQKAPPEFPRTSWLTAIENYATNPNQEGIQRPAAYIVKFARNPRRARFTKAAQEVLTRQQEPEKAKAALEHEQARERPLQSSREDTSRALSPDEKLADEFMRRPSAERVLAVDQLRKSQATDLAGIQRRNSARVIDDWMSGGGADWRTLPEYVERSNGFTGTLKRTERATNSARAGLIRALAAGEQALRAYNRQEPAFL